MIVWVNDLMSSRQLRSLLKRIWFINSNSSLIVIFLERDDMLVVVDIIYDKLINELQCCCYQSIKIFLYKLIGFRIEQKYSIVCFGVWSVTTLCFLLSDILCLVILVVVAFIFSFLKWEVYLLCLFMVRFDLVNLVKQVLENRMFLKIYEKVEESVGE